MAESEYQAPDPTASEDPEEPQSWRSLAGDLFALLLLALALMAAPLQYRYHYYHQLWYVASEAGALLAGVVALIWSAGSALSRRRQNASESRELLPVARPSQRPWVWLAAGYGLYTAWTLMNSFRGLFPVKAWSEWAFIVASGLLAYAVYRFAKRPNLFPWVLAVALLGPALVALVGFDQYLQLHSWASQEMTRIWSTTGNANTLSGFLTPCVPVAVAAAYTVRGPRRMVWWAVALLLATGVLLSYTRGGWYSGAAAIVLLAFLLDRRILVYGLLYVVVAGIVFPGVFTRATTGLEPEEVHTFQERLQLWDEAYYMWRDHPLIGVGTGDFTVLTPKYVAEHPEIDRGLRNREPHNTYLKTLSEQGLIGLVLLVGVILTWWLLLLQAWRRVRPGPRRALLAGLVAAGLALAIHSGTNSVLHDYRSALGFWPLFGLGAALLALEKRRSIGYDEIDA